MTSEWQDIEPETLLPHSGHMVWVHSVQHVEADICETRTDTEKLHLLKQPDGRIPCWAGIEIMAQTAAVHAGMRIRKEHQSPRPGFLVSTRRYQCHVPFLPAGGRLTTRVVREFGSDVGMCILGCTIEDTDRKTMLAEARMNVYIPSEDEPPMPTLT